MIDAIDYFDRGKCDGFNLSHFTEMLEEKEGISSLEEANEYLHSVFLPKHNKKFTRKPKVEESAYRMIVKGKDLDQIFSIKEERPVQGDNTISYKGKLYQILPTETRFGFAKARVEVQKHLDKTIHIFYKGEELPFKPIIPQKDERYALSQIDALAVGVRHFHLAERVI